MCIASGVGRGAKNLRDDVRTVQLLLNMNSPQVAGPLVADGFCGAGTVAAIEVFQHGVVGDRDEPGAVDASGTTLAALRAGIGSGLTQEKLEGICIHATAASVDKFFHPLMDGMKRAQINTPQRQAHFLAQVAHESAEFRYTEELASGEKYEGRKDLGNTELGDGSRFKGRGLIQITGRSNYEIFGRSVGRDFTAGDAMGLLASDTALAVQVALWFWTKKSLNDLADLDDVTAITKKINGGLNGFDDRKAKLERAKFFLLPPSEEAGAFAPAIDAMTEMPQHKVSSRRS